MSVEPWKGDEEPRRSPFASFLGMRELTAAEREQYQADLAAAMAIGELIYPTLPVFDTTRRCVKCGSRKRHVQHHPKASHLEFARQVGAHDYLAVACGRCSYLWLERPVDSQGAASGGNHAE